MQESEGQQMKPAQTRQPSADLQEQLAAALERAAKAEAERAAAVRNLARTQALQRLAREAEKDAIKQRRFLRRQQHLVKAERDDLAAKAIIVKQKAKWLKRTASQQARAELIQMRDDRAAQTANVLSQSAVGRQLAAAKETVRELSNKLIKQRTWRKEAIAIFKDCGVQGPSFKPNIAPAQHATSSPVPVSVQHASSPPAPAQCAASLFEPAQHASTLPVQQVPAQLTTSLFLPAQHASSLPVPAQHATSLFLPAQHASSLPGPAQRTIAPVPPNTLPLFTEQAVLPQLPMAQLSFTMQHICA